MSIYHFHGVQLIVSCIRYAMAWQLTGDTPCFKPMITVTDADSLLHHGKIIFQLIVMIWNGIWNSCQNIIWIFVDFLPIGPMDSMVDLCRWLHVWISFQIMTISDISNYNKNSLSACEQRITLDNWFTGAVHMQIFIQSDQTLFIF